MRKVILGLGISIDGYIARLNGAVDFLFMPKDYSMEPFFRSVDVAVMGRKTWDAARAMAGSFTSPLKTYVFSRTQAAGEREGVVFVGGAQPEALLRKIRQQRGKHIWLMGGGELAREFLKADMVDQLYLGVVPVLIGEGIPLFPSGFPQREFKLVENLTFSKGMISLKYDRVRAKPKAKRS
jgi:dihydrofolate reductase